MIIVPPDCQLCKLCELRTRIVPGYGSKNAKIMFVGEGPGKNEDEQGKPFVGAAGKFLDEMLAGIGMKREDVFITNIVKCRPPNNRDPLPEEVSICSKTYLLKQIEDISPLLVVTLGRHAMNFFFPGKKISQVHGKWLKGRKQNGEVQDFLALYHPAAALYNGGMRTTLMEDMKKVPPLIEKLKNES
jgi:uracil-DNA glycosylase